MTLAKSELSYSKKDWAGAKWPFKRQRWCAWSTTSLEQLPNRQAQDRAVNEGKKATLETQIGQKRADRERNLHATHENTAAMLAAKLPTFPRATDANAYLRRKGISAHEGLRKNCYGNLVIPAQDIHGKVWAAQKIYTDGSKCYQANSLKPGCFHVLDAAPGQGVPVLAQAAIIILAESYATAATIAETVSHPTVVAFDSGNLMPVAHALRGCFPDKPILICGNDDRHLERNNKLGAGYHNAINAAQAVAGVAIFPSFSSDETSGRLKEFISFNDLAQKSLHGRTAVETAIRSGISQAQDTIPRE